MNDNSSALAYLAQATIEVAKEKSFLPTSRKELSEWAATNNEIIMERAMKLNLNAMRALNSKEFKSALTSRIWGEAQKQKINKEVNQSYASIFN